MGLTDQEISALVDQIGGLKGWGMKDELKLMRNEFSDQESPSRISKAEHEGGWTEGALVLTTDRIVWVKTRLIRDSSAVSAPLNKVRAVSITETEGDSELRIQTAEGLLEFRTDETPHCLTQIGNKVEGFLKGTTEITPVTDIEEATGDPPSSDEIDMGRYSDLLRSGEKGLAKCKAKKDGSFRKGNLFLTNRRVLWTKTNITEDDTVFSLPLADVAEILGNRSKTKAEVRIETTRDVVQFETKNHSQVLWQIYTVITKSLEGETDILEMGSGRMHSRQDREAEGRIAGKGSSVVSEGRQPPFSEDDHERNLKDVANDRISKINKETRQALMLLTESLDADERPLDMARTRSENRPGLLVLTNSRLVFAADPTALPLSSIVNGVPYPNIQGVQTEQKMLHDQIEIQLTGGTREFTILEDGKAQEIANAIRQQVRKFDEGEKIPAEDYDGGGTLEKLERAAELRDEGAISDDEFQELKNEILD